jgi:uncharacterized protein YkwD
MPLLRLVSLAQLLLLCAAPAHAMDINTFRKANGLKPLRQQAALTTLARTHAQDMARRQSMDHAGFYAIRAKRGVAAENVAYGAPSMSGAMQQWINSWAHRANMLRPDFTRYGIASAVSASGTRFWALELGR